MASRHIDGPRTSWRTIAGVRGRSTQKERRSNAYPTEQAIVFIGGGVVGSLVGALSTRKPAARKGELNTAFALLIFVVAGYMLSKGSQKSQPGYKRPKKL